MIKQLIIGLACEGPTDYRFLTSIIKRTYENVVLEYTTNVEILDIQIIKIQKKSFIEYTYDAVIEGTNNFGMLVLCLHADADSATDESTFQNKIIPAIKNIQNKKENICKIITPIVPVRMTEAWMLADGECFKEEIGSTNNTMSDLGITRRPESMADPKSTISNAISIAFLDKPARRKKPEISELYLPIGQKCNLDKLEKLDSYVKFKKAVRVSLEKLNYI
ncbi:MAG: hypothetical protein ACPGQR_00175 [Marinirhabdus sp.]